MYIGSSERISVRVALLTGGQDASYAHGLTKALVAQGIRVDFIGSDSLDAACLHETQQIRFLNLRGSQKEDASSAQKLWRVARYYTRLAKYGISTETPIFHILWNNKFESIDRTIAMLYYRACGRRVALTAHNVNSADRDDHDSWWNRLTLRIQYSLADHLFVHTETMKASLLTEFQQDFEKITVIPFGLNDETPRTSLMGNEARARLGLDESNRVALVFGQIAPYKGVEYLIEALPDLIQGIRGFRVLIAGKVKKGHEAYWEGLERRLKPFIDARQVLVRIEHIPDEDVEVYFKAADLLVLPYTKIFQSGLPFLAYSFGLPVVATNVGGLPDDVVEGETGFVCRAKDAEAIAAVIQKYFRSALYDNLSRRRPHIRRLALSRHSWEQVAHVTHDVYRALLGERVL